MNIMYNMRNDASFGIGFNPNFNMGTCPMTYGINPMLKMSYPSIPYMTCMQQGCPMTFNTNYYRSVNPYIMEGFNTFNVPQVIMRTVDIQEIQE